MRQWDPCLVAFNSNDALSSVSVLTYVELRRFCGVGLSHGFLPFLVHSCKKNLFILTLRWCQLKEWSLWLLKGALGTVWKPQVSSFWCASGGSRDQIQGLPHAWKLLYQPTTSPKLYSTEETSPSKELSWDILVFPLSHISLSLTGKLSFMTALLPRQPSLSWDRWKEDGVHSQTPLIFLHKWPA